MFNTFIYDPVYNFFVFLLSVPGIDVGVAVVLLTILVKAVLFPISRQALQTQEAMKVAKPELDAIQEKFKSLKNPTAEQRQELGKSVMDVYKKYNVKPFSSFLLVLIQIPIFLAVYFIFYSGGLPVIKTDILYSFVQVPETVSMTFLHLFSVEGKSIALAIIAAITQFAYMKVSLGKIDLSSKDGPLGALGQDFAKTLQVQMKYGLPILIGVIAYISSVVALYFIATNIFMLVQDIVIKKGIKKSTT